MSHAPGSAFSGHVDATEFARKIALACFHAALDAVDARAAVARSIEASRLGGAWTVVAIGKAAGTMTQGALDALGTRLVAGVLVGAEGHVPESVLSEPRLRTLFGAHPVPDERSVAAGHAVLDCLASLAADAQVLFLVSGGGSSLAEVPVEGVSLADLKRLNAWALGAGKPIGVVNALRRRCSRLKGGGLARALGTRRAHALFVSDVPGDDPRTIASGLLHESPAVELPHDLPPDIAAIVARGSHLHPRERPVSTISTQVVANIAAARRAAANHARAAGLDATIASHRFGGDAADGGRRFARALASMHPGQVRIWGGESTVRLPATPGRGGRNQHLALAAALELDGGEGLALLAAGTDGIDGVTSDAGAIVDGATVARLRDAAIDPQQALAGADSGTALEAAGDLVHTGPTGTNVGDLVIAVRGGRLQ